MTNQPGKQCTINSPAVVEGYGYWSGQDVRIEFHPASANDGITFVRVDQATPVRISATIDHLLETPRRTSLAHAGQRFEMRVEMIEHIMAALAGLGIDNCEVRVDAVEMPGLDGSAQPFVEALSEAGIVELAAPRRRLVVDRVIRLGDDHRWIEARPAAGGSPLTIHYELDYGTDNAIGRQTFEIELTPMSFRIELATSRTFMLRHEADGLLSQGLGTRVSPQDLLIFGDHGPIDNTLRFENECVRHKVLDLVGDLMLSGCDIIGKISAYRAGHRMHAQLVQSLISNIQMNLPWKCSA